MPDSFDLNSDGTVSISLETGEKWTLRRPKLREYRELVENLARRRKNYRQDLADAEKALQARMENAAPDEDIDVNEEADSMAGKSIDLMMEWVNDVLVMLGNPSTPMTDDNAPVWVISGNISTSLFSHWQSVPQARGSV